MPPTSASYASEEARIKAERKYSDVTKYDTNGIVFVDENLVAPLGTRIRGLYTNHFKKRNK